jgi:acyl carrier protein
MTRDDVFEVVKKNILDPVEDVPEDEIDPTRSMVEIGASSLDIVEVVSCSMRDLKVKVPREELMKLDDMNGLVDLLYKAVQEKEQAATEGAEGGVSPA